MLGTPNIIPIDHNIVPIDHNIIPWVQNCSLTRSGSIVQWNNYIEQSLNADENTKLKQLQAACDDELKQRIFDSGNYSSLNTTILFLAKMKELAVITVHKSVHLMNLWRMSQEPDESIRAFVARVTSTADMCGMNIRCTAD